MGHALDFPQVEWHGWFLRLPGRRVLVADLYADGTRGELIGTVESIELGPTTIGAWRGDLVLHIRTQRGISRVGLSTARVARVVGDTQRLTCFFDDNEDGWQTFTILAPETHAQ